METKLEEIRNYEKLLSSIEMAKDIVTKDFLSRLGEYEVYQMPQELEELEIADFTRLYKFRKLVSDKKENMLDKLVTVLNMAYTSNATVITLIQGSVEHTDYYLGIVSKDVNQNMDVSTQGEIFKGALVGNFPGIEIEQIPNSEVKALRDRVFAYDNITSISGIASLRNREEKDFEKYVQGIEHLVDSLQGREYSAIVIADSVNTNQIDLARNGYENIYTQLSPFLQTVLSFNESDAITVTNSSTEGITKSIGESMSLTQNYSKTSGWSKSYSYSQTSNKDTGRLTGTVLGLISGTGVSLLQEGIKALGIVAGAYMGSSAGGRIGGGFASSGESTSKGNTENGSTTKSFGNTVSTNSSTATTHSTTESQANGFTQGRTIQFTSENKLVKNLLGLIDKHIERLDKCEAYGAFNCATYVVSSDPETNAIVSNGYNALMRGDNSSLQSSYMNTWDNTSVNLSKIKEYLKRFSHPLFMKDSDSNIIVSPASMVNSYEMAVNLGMPKKSIKGMPVVECAEFGRNVISVDSRAEGDLTIGQIYHMHHVEDSKVQLSCKDLTAHTFITGSTGSGKSNAIYQILSALLKKPDIKFMVIEPAKGEYKDVFGTNKENTVDVYGTNPKITPLLRINPFRFPQMIHIYEHMDRLIEIFNVCWPMYAAMPAVLKAALEKAYTSAGWDLEKSVNRTGVEIYPTFASVAREVKNYLDSSEYSEENKGDYKGALLTRLESLTNGINGMIFTAADLEDKDLFDRNVIVDLSRVGSQETKALIMGILIMRLQEYRSGTSIKNNELKHVTVLEEAHNLLKRTSTEQVTEGSNLLGKSVEMLSNSIAEMRSYGEAFIIVDQAPGLMDMSVIRNTNTKIILRLPDYTDRELVGKAANLNNEQIQELAKLRTGVAAVYQNNWVAPVLCQFDKYISEEKAYVKADKQQYADVAIQEMLSIIMKSDIRQRLDEVDYRNKVVNAITISEMPDFLKVKILDCLVSIDNKVKAKEIAEIAYDFFEAEESFNEAAEAKDIEEWQKRLIETLKPSVKAFEEEEIEVLLAMLLREHYLAHKDYEPIYLSYMEYVNEKRHYEMRSIRK